MKSNRFRYLDCYYNFPPTPANNSIWQLKLSLLNLPLCWQITQSKFGEHYMFKYLKKHQNIEKYSLEKSKRYNNLSNSKLQMNLLPEMLWRINLLQLWNPNRYRSEHFHPFPLSIKKENSTGSITHLMLVIVLKGGGLSLSDLKVILIE